MLYTIITILQISSMFTSLILLGIIPAYLVYLLYYKIFGKFLMKKKTGFFNKMWVSYGEYLDLRLFEVILPMGFGVLFMTVFKPLDVFIMSYWNLISLPIFIIYFYYSSRLFPKYYHRFKTKK